MQYAWCDWMRQPRLPWLRNFRVYDRTWLMCDITNLLSAVTIELGSSDGNKTRMSTTNRHTASIHACSFFMFTVRVGFWVASQPGNREIKIINIFSVWWKTPWISAWIFLSRHNTEHVQLAYISLLSNRFIICCLKAPGQHKIDVWLW